MTDQSHWIIISPSRRAIWKQPYSSFADAKAEYDKQIRNIPPEETTDWVIEQRWSSTNRSESATQADKEFESF